MTVRPQRFLDYRPQMLLAALILSGFSQRLIMAEPVAPVVRRGDAAVHGLDQAKFDTLRAILKHAVDDGMLPGCSLLIAHRGEVIFKEAAGNFTIDQAARIASDTKPFAATTVMTVVDEGKLSLDDEISQYVPEFRGMPCEHATIRQLLSHTGGIGGVYPGGRPTSGTLAEFARKVAKEGVLKEPGKFSYSGVSIDIACRAAEAASGTSFEELIRKRLWEPLRMQNTYFSMASERVTALPDASARGEGRWVSCGGGLTSTLDDVAAFYQMHLQGGVYGDKRIISQASCDLMHTPVSRNDRHVGSAAGFGPDYGLGFYLSRIPVNGQRKTFHHGGALGTMIWADVDRQLVGVFFSPVGLQKATPVIVALQKRVREFIPVDGASNENATSASSAKSPLAGESIRTPENPLTNREPQPAAEGTRIDPERRFKKISEGADTISIEQYRKSFSARGSKARSPKISDRVFHRLDANMDGALNVDEYKKLGDLLRGEDGSEVETGDFRILDN